VANQHSQLRGIIMDELIITIARFILPAICIVVVAYSLTHLLRSRAPQVTPACLYDELNGNEYMITRWETSIGRSNACDIVLDYSSVSRFHAVIAKHKKGWVITDTNSTTGTLINNRPITEPTVIEDGQEISFGGVILVFRVK
ncbi:MAG: FHA domain-containing protein, partial [Ruminococcus sp.]|nr:FHA domain-containing protein [Candidatus Copronaster equi]